MCQLLVQYDGMEKLYLAVPSNVVGGFVPMVPKKKNGAQTPSDLNK